MVWVYSLAIRFVGCLDVSFISLLCRCVFLITGMKVVWLTLVQVLGRLNPFPV